MRLSGWRKAAPLRECLNDRVLAVLRPVLIDLGTDPDPECWVVWGEDPGIKYSLFTPTPAGVVIVVVRPANGFEEPRANGKLVRWSKLNVSELGIDASGGHRIVAVQVEGVVLKGTDEEADRVCEFVRELIAGIDNRLQQPAQIMVQAAAASPHIKAAVTAAAAPGPRPARAASPRAGKPAAGQPAARKTTPAPAAAAKSGRPAASGARGAARAGKASASSMGGAGEVAALLPAGPTSSPAPAAPEAAPAPASAPRSTPAHRAPRRTEGPAVGRPAARAAPEAPAAPAARPDAEPAPRIHPEPDRTEWIGPHPIEEPERDKKRPRPWMP
jgi:hypothetical protein